MNKVFEQVMLVLDKLYSVVVDRRAFLQVTMLLITFGLIPWTVDQAEQANTELLETIEIVTQAISAVGGLLTLMWSWTNRPPSGTEQYKRTRTTVDVTDAVDKYLSEHPQQLQAAVGVAVEPEFVRLVEELKNK